MPFTRVFRLRRANFHATIDFAGATTEPSDVSMPSDTGKPNRPYSLPVELRLVNGRIFPGWGPPI